MALDKAIIHGKEHRKPYKGAKAVDKACRNHGDCPRCAEGRKHRERKQMPAEDWEAVESLYKFKERLRNK